MPGIEADSFQILQLFSLKNPGGRPSGFLIFFVWDKINQIAPPLLSLLLEFVAETSPPRRIP
jgi:hypothetical protein